VAENSTGYFGVTLVKRSQLKPYKARVRRGGKQVDLGMFATTEEAALCVACSPEGGGRRRGGLQWKRCRRARRRGSRRRRRSWS
jgi:hypothetical protein